MMRIMFSLLLVAASLKGHAGEITPEEATVVAGTSILLASAGLSSHLDASHEYGLAVTDKRLASQLSQIDERIIELKKSGRGALTRALIDEAEDLKVVILDEAEAKGAITHVRLEPLQSSDDAIKAHRLSQAKKGRYLIHIGEVKGDTKEISRIRYNTRTGNGLSQAQRGTRLLRGSALSVIFGSALSYATDISLDANTKPSLASVEDPVPSLPKAGQ